MEEILKKFLRRIENNPKFRYSTINQYRKSIQGLLKECGSNPSIEQLNAFITIKCEKRQFYVKYAIKEFLEMVGRSEDYFKLVPAKVRKPVVEKHFLNKNQLVEISDSIENELSRAIAKIQIGTVSRAFEVITIENKKIRPEQYQDQQGITQDRFKIKLMCKGDKPKDSYISPELFEIIRPFAEEKKKYLFLSKDASVCTKKKFFNIVKNVYQRYLSDLKKAARKNNIELTSHDLRRSVANLSKNRYLAQKLLGHENPQVTEKYLEQNDEVISEFILRFQQGM